MFDPRGRIIQRTVLIAGATGNIGFACALALARRGVRVVLLGRRPERLRAKVDLLLARAASAGAEVARESVETLTVDFADLDSVRRAAATALDRFDAIDGLVHSAGIFLEDGPTVLPGGHEAMFAANVLGPFLFTELLSPRLEECSALVVHVIAAFRGKIDWNDLESVARHKPMVAFNRTKTCNRMIAGEMARRQAGRVAHVAFDPTYVIDKSDPELSRRWPKGLTGFLWHVMTLLFARNPEVAGEPLARLFTDRPDRGALNGALYRLSRRLPKPDAAMRDDVQGRMLWERLEGMAAE